jgi:hypothetical protein
MITPSVLLGGGPITLHFRELVADRRLGYDEGDSTKRQPRYVAVALIASIASLAPTPGGGHGTGTFRRTVPRQSSSDRWSTTHSGSHSRGAETAGSSTVDT